MQAPQSFSVKALLPTPTAASRMLVIGLGVAISAMAMQASEVNAQEALRNQAASGSASFSDRDGPTSNQHTQAKRTSEAAVANLPAALRPVATRYPVKLYTSPDCHGCQLGRTLLERRGIPFQEFRIASPEEQRAANNQGITTLPHLMIGAQALKGFDSQDWTNYLSAAGYPASSVLPASYQAPAVQSVIPAPTHNAPNAVDSPAAQSTPSSNSSAASQDSSATSSGFRF